MRAHELLEQGYVDEIDAVRRAFEECNSDEGDLMSDMYFHYLDLATTPTPYNKRAKDVDHIQNALNNNYSYIERVLGRHGVLGVFRDHMRQADECIWSDFLIQNKIVPVVLEEPRQAA